ncbi:hypothetical protein FBEOM_8827 [Fusarium beomiforme]|uniref:F-box domain-containing protein n=1 Tax=Fusarium beomiforme TaxID=44412 RepID=A0A9P5AEM0_9HYPO|nr:hypothetical protein FBEOM_8827 [Fusarium beomiforme]
MSLLRLPPETLRQIFDQLDPSFFHQDVGRLTVCKQWFSFALPVCYKRITLSQAALRKLIASGVMKKASLLQDNLETLVLDPKRYQSCISPSHTQEYAQESVSLQTASALNEAPSDYVATTEIRFRNDDLAQIAIIVQQSRRLRTLRMRTWSSPPKPDYLSLFTIGAFLSVENLSVLVLDLAGISLDSLAHQEEGSHICPTIAATLRTLRTLHLRMRSICPDVLKPQDPDENLHLSVVAINLSLVTNQPAETLAVYSERCGPEVGFNQLKADMQEEAEALATRMESPKIIRILTPSFQHCRTKSLDVLTGKIMILDRDAAWDEDGKIVQED